MENTPSFPPAKEDEYKEQAWGKTSAEGKFTPMFIARPNVGEYHVKFEMLYAGICHSDVHLGNNDMATTVYPIVPGHELMGKVVEVGSKVTKVKVGDNVGVGCFIDACLECPRCKEGEEQYCDQGMTFTYGGDKKYGRVGGNQETKTCGGYSGSNVVHEHFICRIPDEIPPENAAPILCAGITMYDPLVHWGATQGKKMSIGIIGVGGLGTMGIKLAKALGHDVYAISTSANKEALAKEKGATHFVVSTNQESITANAGKCDLILNTVSADHDLNVYMPLLAKSGTLVQLGLAMNNHQVNQLPLMFNRQKIAGSIIGGMASTQECLDFCAKHKIWPDCQIIEAEKIDWAWDQLLTSNKDGLRFVIDVKKSLSNESFIAK